MEKKEKMIDKLVSLAKRRGFVFPSSEIYGGFAAIYDYGHYGILLKNNIQAAWWKHMVQLRDDVLGLDSAIFMHPTTWVASGHVGGFDDPQIDCRKCKNRMRADHVLESFDINADKAPLEYINEELDKLRAAGKLKCTNCGSTDLTPAKRFSLMVKSNIGSPTDALSEENVVYLRPETCGGIYLEYKNTVDSLHPKLPFGIAQVGKAFRNEIVARQFIFRTREFEQMEMQFFVKPGTDEEWFEYWRDQRWNYYRKLGIDMNKLRWHRHGPDELAHYAKDAYDIEFEFPMGFKELEGVHNRSNYDLSRHQQYSGKDLQYIDQDNGNERYIPFIIETSAGLTRQLLMLLCDAYEEQKVADKGNEDDWRTVLHFHPDIAPITAAVLPLMKKDGLAELAQDIRAELKEDFVTDYDQAGAIGRRYRRQDEIGTPFCVTIDYQSKEDGTVTVRDRDTMLQERVSRSHLSEYIRAKIKSYKRAERIS